MVLPGAILNDVDSYFRGYEIGMAPVVYFDNYGGLALFQPDDMEGPGSIFFVLLDGGDMLISDGPGQRITFSWIWGEKVAVFSDKAHGE